MTEYKVGHRLTIEWHGIEKDVVVTEVDGDGGYTVQDVAAMRSEWHNMPALHRYNNPFLEESDAAE